MKKTAVLTLCMSFCFCLYSAEYVKLGGFHFEGGSESFGYSLEERLQEDMGVPIDRKNYTDDTSEKLGDSDKDGIKNPDEVNQIILAHSQGGIRAMGYMKKMEQSGKLNNIEALVTIDSPVTGFDGLDYGYSHLRSDFIKTLDIQKNGLKGVGAAVSSNIVISWLVDLVDFAIPNPMEYNFLLEAWDSTAIFVNETTEWCDGNLGSDIATDLATFSMKDLAQKLMKNSSATPDIQQITDMGKHSSFVKKYVGKDRIARKKVKDGTYWTIVKKRKYKKVFGKKIYYWVTYPVKRTRYKWVEYIAGYNKAYSNSVESKIGHIVGTDNDPKHLAEDSSAQKDFSDIIKAGQYVYFTAQGINILKCVNPFTAVYYGGKAKDCYKAGNWLKNYKSKWGDLVGGRANDGFITEASQVLPSTSINKIKKVPLDHRTVGTEGVNLQTREIKSGYDAEKKNLIYEAGTGALDQILQYF